MTTIHPHDVQRLSESDREAFLQWVSEQGLDPGNVTSITITGRSMKAQVCVLDDEGRKQVDPRDPDLIWMETQRLPLKTPMPKFVKDALKERTP